MIETSLGLSTERPVHRSWAAVFTGTVVSLVLLWSAPAHAANLGAQTSACVGSGCPAPSITVQAQCSISGAKSTTFSAGNTGVIAGLVVGGNL